MSKKTLYTYFRIDVEDMPIDWDYTICETIEQAGEQLQFFDIHLDDDTIKAKVIITGIGMTKKEFLEWEETKELPARFQSPSTPPLTEERGEVPEEGKVNNIKPWPLAAYAPGNYSCSCSNCKREFMGDKRAVQCLECALKMTHRHIHTLQSQLSEAQHDRDEYKERNVNAEKTISTLTEKLLIADGIFKDILTLADKVSK